MVADQDKLLASAGQGYIKLAINDLPIHFDGLRKNRQLPRLMNDSRVEYHITLRALEALDGIDGNGFVIRNVQCRKCPAHEGYLATERDYDSQSAVPVAH